MVQKNKGRTDTVQTGANQGLSEEKGPVPANAEGFLGRLPIEDRLAIRIKAAKESGDRPSKEIAEKQLAAVRRKLAIRKLEEYGCIVGGTTYMGLFGAAKKAGASHEELCNIAKEQVSIVLDYGDRNWHRCVLSLQAKLEQPPPFSGYGDMKNRLKEARARLFLGGADIEDIRARIKEAKERRCFDMVSMDFIKFIQDYLPEMLPALRSELEYRLDFLITSSGGRNSGNFEYSDACTFRAEDTLHQLSFNATGFSDIVRKYAPKLVYAMAANGLIGCSRLDAASTALKFGLAGIAKSLAVEHLASTVIFCLDDYPFEYAKTYGISGDEVGQMMADAYATEMANGGYERALAFADRYLSKAESLAAARLLIRQHIGKGSISKAVNLSLGRKLLKTLAREATAAGKEEAVAACFISNGKSALLPGLPGLKADFAAIAKAVAIEETGAGNHAKALVIAEHWHLEQEAWLCLENISKCLLKGDESAMGVSEAMEKCKSHGFHDLHNKIMSDGRRKVNALVGKGQYGAARLVAGTYGLGGLEREIARIEDALRSE